MRPYRAQFRASGPSGLQRGSKGSLALLRHWTMRSTAWLAKSLHLRSKVLRQNLPLLTQGLLVWTKKKLSTWMFVIATTLASLKAELKGLQILSGPWKSKFFNQAERACHLQFARWLEARLCLRRAVGCAAKYTAASRFCHMKLNRLSVYPIWQRPAFFLVSAQAQLLLLISSNPLRPSRADLTKSLVFCSVNTAIERRLETLPRDLVLPLWHAFRTELLFIAVLFVNRVALRT